MTESRWLAGCAAWSAGAFDRLAGARLSILIFHRVLVAPDPIFPDEIDAARFDAILALVRRSFEVLTLGRAVELCQQGALPPRALAITFDDGYADNAEIALPILQRHGLAATFFVATGFLDGGRMFNDSVIECVRAARGDVVDLGEYGLGRRTLATPAERRAVIQELLPKVKYLSLAERETFIERLVARCGHPALPRDLMMRSAQVQELHRAGMEIGGHTVRHPILRVLPDAEARGEIAQGRDRLESLIDAPVRVFAYPNGKPMQDYDARHVAMVRELGFAGAVSTAPGVAGSEADRFQLPRFTPWDRSATRWLARLLHTRATGTRPSVAA
jgi:peptidoglycan/xylan/chitin deacetylase (PgdA/CDA1 family)